MPIPPRIAPAPKQSQLYFQPGTGLTSRPVSVPRKELQKSIGAASQSNSLIAEGTGKVTVSAVNLVGKTSYTINVPLSLPTPMTVMCPLTLTVNAPVASGLQGMTINSTTIAPSLVQQGKAGVQSALSIPAGITVTQFLATVTFGWTGDPAPNSVIVLTCSGSLVTV